MSRRRNIPALKIVLIALPLVLVLLLASSAWWLLKTSSGAAWLWGKVENTAAGSVRSLSVNGDLASGFIIQDFEYLSGTVELSVRQLEVKASPQLWPLTIQLSSLLLRDVEIVTLSASEQVEDAETDLQIQSALEALRLPVGVYIHDAEISQIKFRVDDGAPLTVAESLRFSATLADDLVVKQLVLQAPGFEMTLDGLLALEPPFNISVTSKGRIEKQGKAGVPGLAFPFRLESAGKPENLQFTLASPDLELGTEQLDLTISGALSTTGVQLDQLKLTGSGLDLEADGTADWSPDKRADMKLVIRQLDLSPWLTAWPAGQQILGDLELNWSNTGLEIPRGRVGVTGTNLTVNLAADIDVENNAVDALLDWQNLDWPLANTSPDFSSPSGRLIVNGSFDDWQATGELIIKLGDYPQGRLEIAGGGNRTSARMTIPGGEVLGGTVSGEVGADWENGLSWDMQIRTSDIDPEPLLPGWPGQLDVEVAANADSRSELTRIRLASLSGSIRGVPLSGQGGFSLAGDAMTLDSVAFDDVELSTGNAVLQLDGTASKPGGLHLKFNGRLPSTLMQGATGDVDLTGQYSSHTGHSLLDLQLQAHGLTWNGFSARDLAVTAHTDGQLLPIRGVQLEASDLTWRDTPLSALSLMIEPTGEHYRLNASLAAEHITMNTTMVLEPTNQQEPLNHPWRGVLDKWTVTANQQYRFELQEQAVLQWTSKSLLLSPACIREDSGAKFCMSGSYKTNGDLSLAADVAAVPLDYLRDIFDLNVRFEQYLEGRLEWRQLGGRTPTGGAEFRVTAGHILDVDDNDVLSETSEGRFGFKLANGNLESGVLDVEFPGTGFIDVDFKVLDIMENGGDKLRGRAIAQLDSLELVGQLALASMDDVDGQFESNIQLGGSLAKPSFDGTFKLSNGLVRYAPIGLNLDNIEIEGLLKKSNRGVLTGGFRAGDGIGSVDGHILFEDIDSLQGEVSLSGDRLLLVNTDDLKINTEADLKIGLSPERLDINGYIRIPDARLKPANLLVERVSDSEDLVIEGQLMETQPRAGDKPTARRVYGQLEVAFGDDVLLRVPDVKTNITGSVLYSWQGDSIPLANGSYRLKGQVDVYGPTLEITNGSISFPGIPANNPLLNIRAEREIFGNTQIRSAGVQLIGTLKRPVIEAYTVPLTNEDRAWTLLVTGTDFDQGQGVGGFDVGTYIAPKLYVSYGISLFEDENVISARYDLNKGFGIKITSGQRETGVDVSYTIDR